MESLWFASGFSGNFYPTHKRVLWFNRSPIARAFGLTCIRIQGLVMLYFYTARLPSSFGSFGANNLTRTNNQLIPNQLRYRLRHISILKGIVYSPFYTPFNQTLCLARFVQLSCLIVLKTVKQPLR